MCTDYIYHGTWTALDVHRPKISLEHHFRKTAARACAQITFTTVLAWTALDVHIGAAELTD